MEQEMIYQTRALIDFLSTILGDQYEIVFHVITEEEVYIDSIINGNISGRNKDSPLTKFALDLIDSKAYLDKDYVVNYKTITQRNKQLQGSTFFIKNQDSEFLGMICFNLDYSKKISLTNDILENLNLPTLSKMPHSKGDAPKENGGFTEVLSGNVRDIIKEYINIDLLNDSIDLTQEAKMDIVKTLEEKNIFQLKGAVTETAGLLNVSEPTIYRYRKLIANL